MALIATSLIWLTYAICLVLLLLISATVILLYQSPRDRHPALSILAIFTLFALLATVLLTPVDIALTSSTVDRRLGRKKDWATADATDRIVYQLKAVYFALYSLDAVLCLLVVPFAYFWYEEGDEGAQEAGEQTVAGRLWSAAKYTLAFLVLVIILFVVGFFAPVAKKARDEHRDLDYFKHLLTENHGERALTFSIGILITLGTILLILYTAPGLALLPLTLIKSAPRLSTPQLAATTSRQLTQNRERQRQLEGRNLGREGGLDARDRRELESLIREERTLVRRERLAAENAGEGQPFPVRAWHKLSAILRPLKLIAGLLLLLLSLLCVASTLITCVDKLKNSVCGARCGYLLAHTQIFQPVNAALRAASRVFPIDYVLYLLLTLFYFCASVAGLAAVGIRFLWVTLFRIRRGKTEPNGLLLALVLLTLITLALDYSLAMVLAPQYATFGAQTFCDRPSHHPDQQPDCSAHRNAVRPCTERSDSPLAGMVCTPSVVSTFLNSITVNFPVLGAVDFWGQWAFAGVFGLVFLVMLFRVPRFDGDGDEDEDGDAQEEAEGEGLLGSTGRRFGATWQDITGRVTGVKRGGYGTVGEQEEGRAGE